MSLNLAQRPFVNRRPVRRFGYFFWILGLLLAVLNGFLYWDYLSGQGATESGLQEVVGELEEETRLRDSARMQMEGLETEELNKKIEFVNLRILQRTFSWSRLFDVFAETLPDEVRLSSLSPGFDESRRGGGRRRATEGRSNSVGLEIRGQAKSSEALLEFLDRLFAHPAFDDPDLHQEKALQDQSAIAFSISANYRPDIVAAGLTEGAAE